MKNGAVTSFLGRGWSVPVTSGSNLLDAAMVEEEEDIRQALFIILRTERGERVMRPDFGAGLRSLVYEVNNAATRGLVQHRVQEALVRWEPRIHVDKVRVSTRTGAPQVMDIGISYTVRRTNTFYNLVYPFYLQEEKQ